MAAIGAATYIGVATAVAGATVGIVSSNNARKSAEAGAAAQQKQQQTLIDNQKAKELADQQQKESAVVSAENKLQSQNKGGFTSTIATSPTGLQGVGVTGGQKTLLGS